MFLASNTGNKEAVVAGSFSTLLTSAEMANSVRVTPHTPRLHLGHMPLHFPSIKTSRGQQMHQLVKTLVAKLDDLSSVFMYHMERKN